MGKVKTVWEDCDILVVGGGMAGTGAAYEARYWGRDMKIICAEKANIDRSGAVAQGLYAINCYMGMQWDENQPEDHVRYARNDLMGLFVKILLLIWHVMWILLFISLKSGAFRLCEMKKLDITSVRVNGK